MILFSHSINEATVGFESVSKVNWVQFDQFVRAGVPHAVDIAKALSKSSLFVPSSPTFDLRVSDLIYYAPVHAAHRSRVLSRFLSAMEALRVDEHWEVLRNCSSAQLHLIDALSRAPLAGDNECVELFSSWMRIHDPASSIPEPYVFNREANFKRAA